MLMSFEVRRSFRRSHRAAPGHVGLTDQDFAKVSLVELAGAVNAALRRSSFGCRLTSRVRHPHARSIDPGIFPPPFVDLQKAGRQEWHNDVMM